MRRVLVTGSAGFIGRAVCAELARRGDDWMGFDRPHDVRARWDVDGALGQADAVVNLAGVLGTSETFGHERDAADVNILGALTVADAAHRHGVPMVQVGTGHKGQPNPYAITKGCAEDLLLARATMGQRVAVVRAFHAYGPGQKAYPPHGTGHVRKIIPSFVCRALTGMPIEVHGDGDNVIDLVHVDDVARVLVDAVDGPFDGTVLEAGTGLGLTVNTAAAVVRDLCDSTSPIVHLPPRDGEPQGVAVVATAPLCDNVFPFGMDETIAHYREVVARA